VGGAIVVGAGADGILLARGDGDAAIAAYRNRCPHAGFSFARADGSVLVQEGRYIVCPVHGASFALATGACAGGPCDGDALTPIAITIRSGLICGV
jgi:nitrite reductase/ring-hydroxylating ferredoxin subunit